MSSRPRILILGANGQVGQELQRAFAGSGEVVACDRSQIDLTETTRVRGLMRDAAPNVILNAAAYTAVDRAESESDTAVAVNGIAPGILAEEAAKLGALLVHYSTDYVFDGTKVGPWVETDAPHPLNVYGATKLAGERAIAKAGGKYLIFRTSWVYGPRGNNFLFTMLRLGKQSDELKVVDDQIGAPTTSQELAYATHAIVTKVLSEDQPPDTWAGIYHMSCSEAVSWCGFAKAIFERSRGALGERIPKVHPIPASEYPTPAKRPKNSVLSNEKLFGQFGVRLRDWKSALDAVIQQLDETMLR
jgi:dTDP-4-dehydrorhamnose reductase